MAEEKKRLLGSNFFLDTQKIIKSSLEEHKFPKELIREVYQYYLDPEEFSKYLESVFVVEHIRIALPHPLTLKKLDEIVINLQKKVIRWEKNLNNTFIWRCVCCLICVAGVTPAMAVGYSLNNTTAQTVGWVLGVIGCLGCCLSIGDNYKTDNTVLRLNNVIIDIQKYKEFIEESKLSPDFKGIVLDDGDVGSIAVTINPEMSSPTPYVLLEDEEESQGITHQINK